MIDGPRAAAGREPIVSVVIPCFNQAMFLPEAIESAIAQSHPAGEIIVVDDGSTDGSGAIASRYQSVRVVPQANAGLAAARNRGLSESRGSFVVFLDADDRLLPGALQANVEALSADPTCAFAAGHCRIIDDGGAIVAEYPQKTAFGDVYLELVRGNFIAMPGSVMYRRSALVRLGGFDPEVDAAADYDLYLRMSMHFSAVIHRTLVGEYRRHAGNMSNDVALMLRATLRVLARNRRHIQRIPGGREAFEAGLSFWREKYGSRIVHAALFAWEGGRRREAFAAALALARLDRARLWATLRGARQSNELPFVVTGEPLAGADEVALESGPGPMILKLHPHGTAPGMPFNVQPNGESALCLRCRNAPPDAIVMFDGEPLETTVGSAEFVTAIVPRDFFSAPGQHAVHLRSSR